VKTNKKTWVILTLVGLILVGLPIGVFLLGIIEVQREEKAKINRAKLDIKTLDQAVITYRDRHKGLYWPQLLEILAEPDPEDNSPPILNDKTVLVDPWGNPYNYEPASVSPSVEKPKIWSTGPPDKQMMITNFD